MGTETGSNSALSKALAGMSQEQLKEMVARLGLKVPEAEKAQRVQRPRSEHSSVKQPATINLTVNCYCGTRYTIVKKTNDLSPLYSHDQAGSLRATPLQSGKAVCIDTWTKCCGNCRARIRRMSREELEARYIALAEAYLVGRT